ncbi:efflux RND transporter periplasmic adaptor subunit [Solimonas soli]|uniref:efflux RND transporter periplasmic adaptor subunit n=1 Tax=Solimonas soli TaxID=413479 RepID=UPI0004BCF038|nr:efflux RND transporter periplasmic adaptor subunit [Solimonas soli]
MKSLPLMPMLLVAAVLAAATAIAIGAARQPPAADAADATHVEGDSVTLPQASAALLQTAVVHAASGAAPTLPGRLVWDEDRTARVLTPFAGRVVQILARPGDRVAAGQTLAVLMSADFGTAQADARKAQAVLRVAERNWLRQQDLLSHGISAARDVDQAEADFLAAKAEYERAQAQLRLIGDGGAAIDQRLPLKSPVAGVVVERAINPGQELRPDQDGAPLFVITDPDSLWVELDATQADALALAPGATLQLRVPQLPQQRFAAQLTEIGQFFDPQTRSVRLRGRFDNHAAHLHGGTYVTAELPVTAAAAPSAPASTAFLYGSDYYVFVADGERRYTRRKVDVELSGDGEVRFRAGVRDGEVLVADGALFLERILEQNDSARADAAPHAG